MSPSCSPMSPGMSVSAWSDPETTSESSVQLMEEFIRARPDLGNEDIGYNITVGGGIRRFAESHEEAKGEIRHRDLAHDEGWKGIEGQKGARAEGRRGEVESNGRHGEGASPMFAGGITAGRSRSSSA